MSQASLMSSNPTVAPTAVPTRGRSATSLGVGIRVALALTLLAGSAALRYGQSRGVDEMMRQGLVCPFPLKTLPMSLGDWEGTDEAMDPQIARNTGCTDYVFRTYTNTKTGTRIGLILLYGPAEEVFLHAPEKCYPSAGYTTLVGPESRTVEVGPTRYPFTSLFFAKGEGGQAERQEVYYTWRYLGRWTPQLVVMKRIERIPGMFKVHLSRQAGLGEIREVGNPCEAFLAELMPWVDHRLAETEAKTAPERPTS